jgi:hypothetical protein
MRVAFGQTYIEGGANFPFSHHFQKRLLEEVTALVEPSPKFCAKYGKDWDLIFNISAKKALRDNEIRGPTVFRKAKDVEYTIFLPFRVIMQYDDAPRVALRYLLKGVCEVLDQLEIDKRKLVERQESLIEEICSDPTMLEAPSWDPKENRRKVRRVFTAFFERTAGKKKGTSSEDT